jgi:hypothetical protein
LSDKEEIARDLVGETFVTVSDTAPVLRVVIDNYLKRSGTKIRPAHKADRLAMGMPLIASTRGVGLFSALCLKESKHGLSGLHRVGPAEKHFLLAGLVFGAF